MSWYFANIWAKNNLTGVVISEKPFNLTFLPYIAVIGNSAVQPLRLAVAASAWFSQPAGDELTMASKQGPINSSSRSTVPSVALLNRSFLG
jgi:hypothetical protein